jgi:hypothetical protein
MISTISEEAGLATITEITGEDQEKIVHLLQNQLSKHFSPSSKVPVTVILQFSTSISLGDIILLCSTDTFPKVMNFLPVTPRADVIPYILHFCLENYLNQSLENLDINIISTSLISREMTELTTDNYSALSTEKYYPLATKQSQTDKIENINSSVLSQAATLDTSDLTNFLSQSIDYTTSSRDEFSMHTFAYTQVQTPGEQTGFHNFSFHSDINVSEGVNEISSNIDPYITRNVSMENYYHEPSIKPESADFDADVMNVNRGEHEEYIPHIGSQLGNKLMI